MARITGHRPVPGTVAGSFPLEPARCEPGTVAGIFPLEPVRCKA